MGNHMEEGRLVKTLEDQYGIWNSREYGRKRIKTIIKALGLSGLVWPITFYKSKKKAFEMIGVYLRNSIISRLPPMMTAIIKTKENLIKFSNLIKKVKTQMQGRLNKEESRP